MVSFAIFHARLGKADELYEFLRQSLRHTREFAGLADTYIAQSREDPNIFFTYAKWSTLEAYAAMQKAYAGDPDRQQDLADITQTLACEPVMGDYLIVE
jgi:heme-degrading monooxygenase HmoA